MRQSFAKLTKKISIGESLVHRVDGDCPRIIENKLQYLTQAAGQDRAVLFPQDSLKVQLRHVFRLEDGEYGESAVISDAYFKDIFEHTDWAPEDLKKAEDILCSVRFYSIKNAKNRTRAIMQFIIEDQSQ